MEDKKTQKINVRVVANLFEVVDPLVVLLSKKAGTGEQHYVACAVPDDAGLIDYYFAVFVGRKHLIRYLNEQCDLRFLFAFANGRKYYSFKNLQPSKAGTILLKDFDGSVTESLLPDGRFFASSHTSKYGINSLLGGEQRLLIDGHWDMQEFGAFYQKFADLYSYEQAIQYVDEVDSGKMRQVEQAFTSKPFKGGSSYMGFFDDLFELIPVRERPSLDGIEYHSPGHVDLRGKDEILDAVKRSVDGFLLNSTLIEKAHDELRLFMTKSKLLSITGGVKDLTADVSKELHRLTSIFYEVLPVGGKSKLRNLTKSNAIVHAKVGLALYRRLRATAYFFAQGRLTYSTE